MHVSLGNRQFPFLSDWDRVFAVGGTQSTEKREASVPMHPFRMVRMVPMRNALMYRNWCTLLCGCLPKCILCRSGLCVIYGADSTLLSPIIVGLDPSEVLSRTSFLLNIQNWIGLCESLQHLFNPWIQSWEPPWETDRERTDDLFGSWLIALGTWRALVALVGLGACSTCQLHRQQAGRPNPDVTPFPVQAGRLSHLKEVVCNSLYNWPRIPKMVSILMRHLGGSGSWRWETSLIIK